MKKYNLLGGSRIQKYQKLVRRILEDATYKPNRTGVDTLSSFSQSYKIDLQKGFPLLTTKDMSGYRWESLIHELLWYFSGEEHIRNLKENTKIWDAWADEDGMLETAYGRFWRRFPVPEGSQRIDGEAWASKENEWTNEEDNGLTFDQLGYIIDTLKGDNPDKSQNSRRLVVNAWHPANAAVSSLPPCHFSFVFNVQGNKLNTHLTQRSGDTALGIPFNIAAYSMITKIVAQLADLELGHFSHTVVDAHIYCGKGERGEWYSKNLEELKNRVKKADKQGDYLKIKKWIEHNAPSQEKPFDHVTGLLKQLSRETKKKPKMEISKKPIDELKYEDFELSDYNPHPGIKFAVAE